MQDIVSKKIEWSLRISLGLTYLYSGFDLFMHPTAWVWALPFWLRGIIESVVSVTSYIKFQGLTELVFALVMLVWVLPRGIVRWVSLISALEFVAILALGFMPWNATNFTTTFRDIGLVGASLALYFLTTKNSVITSVAPHEQPHA
jgi:hypothetical protein